MEETKNNQPIIRLGQHMPGHFFDQISDGALGTKDNPFRAAPDGWPDCGLPYGAFCRCGYCNELGRSTIAFDFYAEKAGDKLQCETCMMREMFAKPAKAVQP